MLLKKKDVIPFHFPILDMNFLFFLTKRINKHHLRSQSNFILKKRGLSFSLSYFGPELCVSIPHSIIFILTVKCPVNDKREYNMIQ
jgi:hypothetical protein